MQERKPAMQIRLLVTALMAAMLLALPASAACYADYRAKREDPLRLHYGVVQLPDSACGDTRAATRHLQPRLQQDGWILLDLLSTFGSDGLETRRERAGQYFLRY